MGRMWWETNNADMIFASQLNGFQITSLTVMYVKDEQQARGISWVRLFNKMPDLRGKQFE